MRKTMTALAVVAAGWAQAAVAAESPQDAFFANLSQLCGKRFAGALASKDPQDADFAAQKLTAHVRDCSPTEIRIPFAVGEDRSRTWVITRTAEGIRLKHDHRHEDGTEDALSQYGGDTVARGTAERQEFPADAFSKELFASRNAHVSIPNVWAFTLIPGESLTYELRRPGRDFRVAFDLARPLE